MKTQTKNTRLNGSALQESVANGPGKIHSEWMLVTPPQAIKWLGNNTRNRKMSLILADRYAEDMKSGDWCVTHQGIAFLEDGTLADGQNRLRAIVISDQPQWMLVTFGLPEKSIEVLDRGKARTLQHTLEIMGYEGINSRLVSTCKAMIRGPRNNTSSFAKLSQVWERKFLDRHWQALLFAMEAIGYNAPTSLRSVVARAYYHAPKDELERFARAFHDEIPSEEMKSYDVTARSLQRMYQTYAKAKGIRAKEVTLYRKAQRALMAYLHKASLQKIMEDDEDLFPLPEEEVTVA